FSKAHLKPTSLTKKNLQNSSSLLVDEPRDPLHAAPPRKPVDHGLCDSLDIDPQDLPVPLRAALSQAFASLSTVGHFQKTSKRDLGFIDHVNWNVRF
ncbi:hypothetical protein U1Q18_045155, partial [Sarracenia purpurea var. burkii]